VSTNNPGVLVDVLKTITQMASFYAFASLTINQEKTAFLSGRYRRTITGLTVTSEHRLSIGRDRKTLLKLDIYKYQQRQLPKEQWARVRGTVAFVKDVEPTFYSTLVRKYGARTIDGLERLSDE
jgi:hypothetical protein